MHFPSDLHSDSPDDASHASNTISLPYWHCALPPSTTHKASAQTCCFISFTPQLTLTSALIICYMIYHIRYTHRHDDYEP